jgi:hypothetical protein
MESKDVRAELGLTVEKGQLCSELPGSELIKPLKKIVLDIAGKAVDSRRFNKTEKMLDYVRGFKKAEKPDLSKKVARRPIEGIQKAEFVKAAPRTSAGRRPSTPPERRQIVPKNCHLNVTDNRIHEIYQELRTLKLTEARNAIAVLLRVFLEMSVDHFLENNGGELSFKAPDKRVVHKKLDKKLAETVAMLVSMGVPKTQLAAVVRSLSVGTSPMNIELFHLYVHERFATPSPQELTAAWNNGQPLFENIWP